MDGKKTAFELWTKKRPNLEHARPFKTIAYTHIPKIFTTKFDARVKKAYLVGYEKDSRNYRVYDSATGKVTVSRNVLFSETVGMDNPDDTKEPLELNFKQLKAQPRDREDEPTIADAGKHSKQSRG